MTVQTPAYESLGRPIRGPQAISGGWRRFWHLTFNIAVMQWKVRFYGSALGYLWQLVRPLLLFLVLYVFFTQIAHIGKGSGRQLRLLRGPAARSNRAVHILRRGDDGCGAQRRR